MGFDMNVEFLRMAFWQIVMVAGPVLLVALGIGLFIGIIQAATSSMSRPSVLCQSFLSS